MNRISRKIVGVADNLVFAALLSFVFMKIIQYYLLTKWKYNIKYI